MNYHITQIFTLSLTFSFQQLNGLSSDDILNIAWDSESQMCLRFWCGLSCLILGTVVLILGNCSTT